MASYQESLRNKLNILSKQLDSYLEPSDDESDIKEKFNKKQIVKNDISFEDYIIDEEYKKIWRKELILRDLMVNENVLNRPDSENITYNLIEVDAPIEPNEQRINDMAENYLEQKILISDGVQKGTEDSPKFMNFIWPESIENEVCFAGGAALGGLIGAKYEDHDVFIIPLVEANPLETYEERKNDRAIEILRIIYEDLYVDSNYDHVSWTKNSVTFTKLESEGLALHKVQVILRAYTSLTEVITGFDIDAACVAFYKGKTYVTERGEYAIKNKLNTVNLDLSSTSYEYRLLKYVQKGFSIQLPKQVTPKTMEVAYSDLRTFRMIFSNNLGWLVWNYIKIHAKNMSRISRDEVPSDYSYNGKTISNDIIRESVKSQGKIISIDITGRFGDAVNGKIPLDYPQYNWAEFPIKLSFKTKNPGEQTSSWSFHPLSISLVKWLSTEVISKGFKHPLLPVYDFTPISKTYYFLNPWKDPRPPITEGSFIELWPQQSVTDYAKKWNVPLHLNKKAWLKAGGLNRNVSGSSSGNEFNIWKHINGYDQLKVGFSGYLSGIFKSTPFKNTPFELVNNPIGRSAYNLVADDFLTVDYKLPDKSKITYVCGFYPKTRVKELVKKIVKLGDGFGGSYREELDGPATSFGAKGYEISKTNINVHSLSFILESYENIKEVLDENCVFVFIYDKNGEEDIFSAVDESALELVIG